MSSYRNLNLGAKLVNGVPRSFSKSSFFQPIIDIYNNKGGVTNESLNCRLPARCSIFDLSHYNILRVSGKDKLTCLQKHSQQTFIIVDGIRYKIHLFLTMMVK